MARGLRALSILNLLPGKSVYHNSHIVTLACRSWILERYVTTRRGSGQAAKNSCRVDSRIAAALRAFSELTLLKLIL